MSRYELVYHKSAREVVRKFHPEVRSLIKKAIESLRTNPHQGKELKGEFLGYNSMTVKRYRVIYKVEKELKIIKIYFMGPRRTVYDNFKIILGGIRGGEKA